MPASCPDVLMRYEMLCSSKVLQTVSLELVAKCGPISIACAVHPFLWLLWIQLSTSHFTSQMHCLFSPALDKENASFPKN